LATAAAAADRVKLLQGTQSTGELSAMSATEVTVSLGATKKTHAVNEIESVQFDSEPNQLTQARLAVAAGRYDDAAALLAKIGAAELKRPEIAKDVEFYRALVAARLALAGQGSIADAGKKMLAFEKANHDSYHYFAACETLGDLLVGLGNYAGAEAYYKKFAEAPWPDYKMRADVLLGRALVGQKQFEPALARFDGALAVEAQGPAADAARAAATLGKAEALAGGGQHDAAIKLVQEVIAKADVEDAPLQARAHNVLGHCYRAAGKKQEAILAYLLVELVYPASGQQHAEALANLAMLWAEVDKPQRAAEARSQLKEKYPSSIWASKL
jgi:tetratricopeptide (TPR) repeat protein